MRGRASSEHGPTPGPGARLRIGEVARRSGIAVETLRFYERAGLLDRPARTASGYRLYDLEVLARLDFIRRAQALGFALAEIKEIVDHKRAGQSPCAEVRAIIRQRLAELDERLEALRRYRAELGRVFREWERLGEADGHVCGLIEGVTMPRAAEHTKPHRRSTR